MDRKEEKIIRCILDGQTELFEHFLHQYGEQVFHLVLRIVGQREDAEEITQDVFLKAFDRLSAFRGRSSFSTWIYAIAYHEAVSHTRRQTVRQADCDVSALADEVVDEALDDMHESRIRLLQQAVGRLEAEERVMLDLFYKEGKSLQDMAVIVGQSVGNVKVRLHRIRKKLYVWIKEEEERL